MRLVFYVCPGIFRSSILVRAGCQYFSALPVFCLLSTNRMYFIDFVVCVLFDTAVQSVLLKVCCVCSACTYT